MKFIGKAAVLSMLCLMSMGVHAQEEQKCGDDATWSYSDGTLTISGSGAMCDYGNGNPDAPWPKDELKAVVIDSGITTIGNKAFIARSKLTQVTLPNTITSIGDCAFEGCDNLTSIKLPNTVTSLGTNVFKDCMSLQEITLSNKLTAIPAYAFYQCASLKTISIPDSVTSIGAYAFNRTGLKAISIPSSVTSIGVSAFDCCDSLASVIFATGINLTSIGGYAFTGCTALTSITLPSSLTSIGDYSFKKSGLTSVAIPDSVTSIGRSAFSSCASLASVTFAAGINLASIGNFVFYECSSLTSITLPNSLISISDNLFDACTNLASVTLPANLTSIGSESFNECGLTSVSIPASVTSIGNSAFNGCTALTSITLPDNLTSIGDYSFSKSGLTSVIIPASVTNIGNNAFSGCDSLVTVTLPGSMTSISYGLFDHCTKLASVTLPASLESIGEYAFQSSGLTSAYIPASVTSIGKDAFFDCTNLSSLSFADDTNLTSVGDDVFAGCISLTSVTLPDCLTSISYRLFFGCTSLTSVTLPAGLESIGVESFTNSGLTSIEIPASVTTIGNDAFSACYSLVDVYVKWPDPFTLPSDDSNSIFRDSRINTISRTLHVPYGKTDAYKNKGWEDFTNVYGFAHFAEPNLVYVDSESEQHEFDFAGGPLTISDNFQTFISTKEVTGVDITYTRTFSRSDVWQAWYMPFDAAYTEMSEKYEVAQILGVFMDAAGQTYITFQPMTSGTVKANTPYVVRPKSAGEVSLTIHDANLKLTQDTAFTIQSSTHNFKFGGIYEKTVNGTNGWYAINTSGNFQALGENVYLKPMRVWMTVTERSDNPYVIQTPAPSQVMVRVLGDDSTGIGLIESDENGGQEYRLSEKIVIVNGKKYLR